MDLEAFARNITFKGIQPYDVGAVLATDEGNVAETCTADFSNTVFPEHDTKYKSILSEACRTPRMSTIAIGGLIHKIVSEMSSEHQFVNVGIWKGFSYFCEIANNPDKNAVAIDNFSEFGGPRDAFLQSFEKFKSVNHQFYEMDYEEYFRTTHSGTIGSIFTMETMRENTRKEDLR